MENTAPAAQTCVTPRRKRVWTPSSVTNLYSAKRRRISVASVDLSKELSAAREPMAAEKVTVADRFISAPQEHPLPLNTTPRSVRIARSFGLADARVLKFRDTNASVSTSHELRQHRSQFARLLASSCEAPPTSSLAHLGKRKHFTLALDAPGVSIDPFAHPLSWSAQNNITVACGRDVHYQNLDSRTITHLCKLPRYYGHISSIEWAAHQPHVLAVGTTCGIVTLRDANTKQEVSEWSDSTISMIGGMSWKEHVLAVGMDDGEVNVHDVRTRIGTTLTSHKSRIHGVRWSPNGKYLLTSDHQGIVRLWDVRGGKDLTVCDTHGGRMKHGAPVKAVAWCPWKSELFATGSSYPDGRIHIWSVNSITASPAPLHTISLNTAVTSLIWSPHCKELLSTHGSSWTTPPASAPVLSHSAARTARPVPTASAQANSLMVHAYPSCKRLVTVCAHQATVGNSALSPDGTSVFTICPAEEAMKMWRVWGTPESVERRESAFDRCTIR
ncbi:WD40 repeat-like protein [Obba rivulosa]|uniref:WD40 repeat-like protein n=1 Tax=Obba rivulosa TaxID=1052685 RepID=A0A8E2B2A3_9APHY|nr:WD40 repeat-like protein [Obba rivulosa]